MGNLGAFGGFGLLLENIFMTSYQFFCLGGLWGTLGEFGGLLTIEGDFCKSLGILGDSLGLRGYSICECLNVKDVPTNKSVSKQSQTATKTREKIYLMSH